VSYTVRRIVALAVVLLVSTLGGLLAALFDSRVAPVLGVVAGAVVGLALVVIWAGRRS
jgi:uncharacterized protein involved in cysteine biosynthesis